MSYSKKLPNIDEVQEVTSHIDHFPIAAKDVVDIASRHRFGKDVVNFLSLFKIGGGTDFTSMNDYVTRTSELLMLIREEILQPREKVVSP